jgi:hypothetical protein
LENNGFGYQSDYKLHDSKVQKIIWNSNKLNVENAIFHAGYNHTYWLKVIFNEYLKQYPNTQIESIEEKSISYTEKSTKCLDFSFENFITEAEKQQVPNQRVLTDEEEDLQLKSVGSLQTPASTLVQTSPTPPRNQKALSAIEEKLSNPISIAPVIKEENLSNPISIAPVIKEENLLVLPRTRTFNALRPTERSLSAIEEELSKPTKPTSIAPVIKEENLLVLPRTRTFNALRPTERSLSAIEEELSKPTKPTSIAPVIEAKNLPGGLRTRTFNALRPTERSLSARE